MKKGNRAGLILFILFFIAVPLVLLLSVFDYGPNPLSFAAEDYLGMTLNEMAEIWGDDYIYTDKIRIRKDGKKYAWQGIGYKDNRNQITCYIPVDPNPLKPEITGEEPIELVFFWKDSEKSPWVNDVLSGKETTEELRALGARHKEMRTGNTGYCITYESGSTVFDNGSSIFVMKEPSVLVKNHAAFYDLPHLSEVHAALILPQMRFSDENGGEVTGKYITDPEELEALLDALKAVYVTGQSFVEEDEVIYAPSASMLIRFYSGEPMREETLEWGVMLNENATSFCFVHTPELAQYTVRSIEGGKVLYYLYQNSVAEETDFWVFGAQVDIKTE